MSLKRKVVDLMPNPLVKIFAAPYVSGDSEQSAVTVADAMWRADKLMSTIDLLGEEVTNDAEVEATISSYIKLIDLLGQQEHATVSLKPTQLGSHKSVAACQANIARIVEYAAAKQIPVTIDMEDHDYTDMTLAMYKALLPRFPTLGTVLQTRLHRTEADIAGLKGLRTRVRLCIGIYLEPPERALQRKPEMKTRMLAFTERMLDDGHFVEFGTHDVALIHQCLNMAERRGFGPAQLEVQMLMGVPRTRIQQELIAAGYNVRLYVPYAVMWKHATSYCKRRLAANPNMAFYVLGNLIRKIGQR